MSFQTFHRQTRPDDGPARLAALRQEMARTGLDAVLIPRADVHQGEYVAPRDARLAWLTGFTGSAGFAIVTQDRAGVFIDGRYRVQVKSEVDLDHFTPVPWPETGAADWLRAALPSGGVVGFDPWLHTRAEIAALERAFTTTGIGLDAVERNPVDAIWPDQPAAPSGAVRLWPEDLAGETAAAKRARVAAALRQGGARSAVLTLPDSIAWLFNIRGSDVARNPVVHGFAIIEDSGQCTLFTDPAKVGADVRAALGPDVVVLPQSALIPALSGLSGPVQIDPATAPEAVFRLIERQKIDIIPAPDPVILPKAIKNPAEVEGMRRAHLADGAAVVRLLAWLDQTDPTTLTEIDVARRLESYRQEAGIYDISFESIIGAGPNGAIVHYRVSEESNRPLRQGDVLLIDSGGQYPTGTTDITRTVALGPALAKARRPFTRVLQGMIALSTARFPKGVAGAHLDALARAPLWRDGMDYDHGTGHGVGAGLSVHEGPVRISRLSDLPLQEGMILSNEPGYYREGAFGIRIENLIVVRPVEAEPGRTMLGFETLTFAPIDRRMIDLTLLSDDERAWIDAYHAEVLAKIGPRVDGTTRDWLAAACAPLGDHP